MRLYGSLSSKWRGIWSLLVLLLVLTMMLLLKKNFARGLVLAVLA